MRAATSDSGDLSRKVWTNPDLGSAPVEESSVRAICTIKSKESAQAHVARGGYIHLRLNNEESRIWHTTDARARMPFPPLTRPKVPPGRKPARPPCARAGAPRRRMRPTAP